jgi:hypothetical protein
MFFRQGATAPVVTAPENSSTVITSTGGTSTTGSTVFVINSSNQLYRHDNTGWNFVGGGIGSASAVTESPGGASRVVVFVITTGAQLYRFDTTRGWTLLGSNDVGPPSAGTDSQNNADVYVLSSTVFYEWTVANGWQAIGGAGSIKTWSATTNNTVAVTTSAGAVEFFNGSWNLLTSNGFSNSISAVREPAGNLVVFAIQTGGNSSLEKWELNLGWIVEGNYDSNPSAGLDTSNLADVFVTSGGNLYVFDKVSGWSQLGSADMYYSAVTNGAVFVVTSGLAVCEYSPAFGWQPVI